jgi:hypothetical protein
MQGGFFTFILPRHFHGVVLRHRIIEMLMCRSYPTTTTTTNNNNNNNNKQVT